MPKTSEYTTKQAKTGLMEKRRLMKGFSSTPPFEIIIAVVIMSSVFKTKGIIQQTNRILLWLSPRNRSLVLCEPLTIFSILLPNSTFIRPVLFEYFWSL